MSEARLTVPQAVDTLACQEVCGSVESESNDPVSVSRIRKVKAAVPGEEIHQIHLLAILLKHKVEKDRDMTLEGVEISDAIFCKLWSEAGARVLPELSISREDRVTQKWLPSLLDAFSFVKIFELRGQHSFDVLRVSRHDGSGGATHDIDSVRSFDMTLSETLLKQLEEAVRLDCFDDFP